MSNDTPAVTRKGKRQAGQPAVEADVAATPVAPRTATVACPESLTCPSKTCARILALVPRKGDPPRMAGRCNGDVKNGLFLVEITQAATPAPSFPLTDDWLKDLSLSSTADK